jgi:PAS domain S-box-containing protein
LEDLSRFVGAAILAGDSALVIATESHRDSIIERLSDRGLDLTRALSEGRFVSLDAAQVLESLMVGGVPSAELFRGVVGDLIGRLASADDQNPHRVVVYGEMVALLWAAGKQEAVIRLEQFWNELAKTHLFQLHCAYPLTHFPREQDGKKILEICAEHSHVVPAEQYTTLADHHQRSSAIVSLQQKAIALESEIHERMKIEQTLQDRERELREFLDSAAVGIHWVAPDGTILWANRAELSLLGYQQNEYVGRHISEFHADRVICEDILQRLCRNEELRNYEARLKCKDGSIRHVRFDSNFLVRDGRVLHTRCFTTDLTGQKEAEQALFQLAAIVESSDDAIVSKDLNGVIKSWNFGAERILGYKASEIIGRPITTLIPPELREEEDMVLSKIRKGERIDHFETVRLTKSGRRIDVSLTISPVKNRQGIIVGAAKILRDITEQRQANAARSHLAAIVDSSADAIISKDVNGIVTGWNQSAERILGYRAEEIVGRPITLIIPPEFLGDETLILGKIRAGERVEHFETVRVKKNGERIDVSLTISPVRDERGKVIGAAKILRDITQQKKTEAKLHISERLASVGRLASTVAHEINNPLAAVTNCIYLANQHPKLPEDIKSHLNSADQEIRRVAHITQQTLGFYRDNSKPTLLVLTDVIQDVLNIYERKCLCRSLTIEQQIEPGLTVITLQGELKQILSNLVSNAIDASRDNGKIVIRARSSQHSRAGRAGVRISIADYGIGIPDQDKEKLFTPFFTTKTAVGTGLGLWITKELLEKSGGYIRFRSRQGQKTGTVMSFLVPNIQCEESVAMG